jgi:hypothetical protein
VGTDTCQLLIYNADKGKVTHTFDPVSNVGPAMATAPTARHPVQTCLTVLLLPFAMCPAGSYRRHCLRRISSWN